MCTAITYQTKDHYFGRNLDYEFSYEEQVTVTPRNYPFHFREKEIIKNHYAMIGMAYVVDDYPLYYDATNEAGLSMAGLLFSENAVYQQIRQEKDNITPFEFIPWILAQCSNLAEAKTLLEKINLVSIPFSDELPLSPLHWIIADKQQSITVEAVSEGLRIYDNPIGVLTNNPPFPYQMWNLNNYMHVSNEMAENRFLKGIKLKEYSRGMGGIGLPGDLSSASRFVRAAFVKMNAVSGESEEESVNQFFHILGAVEQQRGCVKMDSDLYEITIYSSCCNVDRGIYYYTTYNNRQIYAVDMYHTNLEQTSLTKISLLKKQIFCHQ